MRLILDSVHFTNDIAVLNELKRPTVQWARASRLVFTSHPPNDLPTGMRVQSIWIRLNSTWQRHLCNFIEFCYTWAGPLKSIAARHTSLPGWLTDCMNHTIYSCFCWSKWPLAAVPVGCHELAAFVCPNERHPRCLRWHGRRLQSLTPSALPIQVLGRLTTTSGLRVFFPLFNIFLPLPWVRVGRHER